MGVVVHIVRHGKAAGQRPDAALTEEGRAQASEAGRKLLGMIPEGAAVKIYASPFKRTQETSDLIAREFAGKRKTYTTRLRKQLEIQVKDWDKWAESVKEAGGFEKYVEKWFRDEVDPAVGGGATAHAEKIEELLKFPKKLADRIPERKQLHFVYATHAIVDPLIERLTGKSYKELGGTIGNCETFSIYFPKSGRPFAEYRGQKLEVKR
jgi:broad specificity phosphatase PhoE